MKKIRNTILLALGILTLSACDAHKDVEDTSMKLGDILCVDGNVMPYSQYVQQDKQAVAVVFHLNEGDLPGTGYAVYLWDVADKAFADTVGTKQGTSADATAYDGNGNTYSLLSNRDISSPIAESVYAVWSQGQSAYIPSVAEMRLLHQARSYINPIIEKCGGEPLPSAEVDCWYWTSTEVEGQETHKAWLYSLESGAILETPKDQSHKVRPIITLYK